MKSTTTSRRSVERSSSNQITPLPRALGLLSCKSQLHFQTHARTRTPSQSACNIASRASAEPILCNNKDAASDHRPLQTPKSPRISQHANGEAGSVSIACHPLHRHTYAMPVSSSSSSRSRENAKNTQQRRGSTSPWEKEYGPIGHL